MTDLWLVLTRPMYPLELFISYTKVQNHMVIYGKRFDPCGHIFTITITKNMIGSTLGKFYNAIYMYIIIV